MATTITITPVIIIIITTTARGVISKPSAV